MKKGERFTAGSLARGSRRWALVAVVVSAVGCQDKAADSDPAASAQGTRAGTARGPGAELSAKTAAAETGKDDSLRNEIETICFAEERSGAFELEESARAIHVAQWLGARVRSDEGRAFLASLAQVPAIDKADFLRKVAKEQRISGCPLADTWSGG